MGNIQVVGPNKALVISGSAGKASHQSKEARVVVGGRAFIPWFIQRADTLSLELRTIQVDSKRSATALGVMVNVTGCCQVKISGFKEVRDERGQPHLERDTNAILLAAQHFIQASDKEIEESVAATLEGHQRSILGTLTVEELYKDRSAFSIKVRDMASEDLRLMGMEIVSYTIATIADDDGYLDAIGVAQTAEVKKLAEIGESKNKNESKQRNAEEELKAHLAINEGRRKKEESDRNVEISKAQFREEVNVANAKADAAKLFEEAKLMQNVVQEKAKQEVVKAAVEVDVETERVRRRRMELDASVRAQAEAELFQKQKEAEGLKQYAEAEAERIRLIGAAEATALREKETVEVEMMKRKAEAFKEYGSAALATKMIEALPEVATAIATPLSKTEKIVFMGAGNGSGPSQMMGEVARGAHVVSETLESMTGVSLGEVLKGDEKAGGLEKWVAPLAVNAMMRGPQGAVEN